MLLVRIRPNKSESFQTYCNKLAQSNGYNFSAFTAQIGREAKRYKSTVQDDRKEIVDLIATITGYQEVADVVDLQACYHTHKSFIDYTRIKICPYCIGNGKLPLYWSLKNYLVCASHKTQMIDVCSTCEVKLSEESLRQSCCVECLKPLNEMSSSPEILDQYSNLVYRAFSDFQGSTLDFTQVIDSQLRQPLEELIVLEHIHDKLEGLDRTQEKKKRLFTLNELHRKQLACDQIAQDKSNIRSMLLRYVLLQVSSGHVNFSIALVEIINMLKYQGAERVKEAFNEILFQPHQQIEHLVVGILWLEKHLYISSKALVEFAKNNCSNLILKTQGQPSIQLRDVKYLVQEYGGE